MKRLCRGAAIVVSPLLSLIQDQMAALKALGIPARTISSRLGMAEVVRTLQGPSPLLLDLIRVRAVIVFVLLSVPILDKNASCQLTVL